MRNQSKPDQALGLLTRTVTIINNVGMCHSSYSDIVKLSALIFQRAKQKNGKKYVGGKTLPYPNFNLWLQPWIKHFTHGRVCVMFVFHVVLDKSWEVELLMKCFHWQWWMFYRDISQHIIITKADYSDCVQLPSCDAKHRMNKPATVYICKLAF